MSTQELLNCPFCGHVGLDFAEGSTFRWLAYSCGGCSIGGETRMQTMGEGTSEEWMAQAKLDAIKEWNTRAPAVDQAPPAIQRPASAIEDSADALDARRYRWLRDNPRSPTLDEVISMHQNRIWDAAIDAAMTPAPNTASGSGSNVDSAQVPEAGSRDKA